MEPWKPTQKEESIRCQQEHACVVVHRFGASLQRSYCAQLQKVRKRQNQSGARMLKPPSNRLDAEAFLLFKSRVSVPNY